GDSFARFRKDIVTNLDSPPGLMFHPDGRLLVTSAHALLEFSGGGTTARWFAGGWGSQVCVDRTGQIYMTQNSGTGSVIKVFNLSGELIQSFPGTPGTEYDGIAVRSDNILFVNRVSGAETGCAQ